MALTKLALSVGAVACLLLASSTTCATAESTDLSSLEYDVFPTRTSAEAAVVEWGHSAIISALDGAVASFGPQTSRGAFFEVEAMPVLADPVDGNVDKLFTKDGADDADLTTLKLKNTDEVEGNMVVMTNAAGLSGVEMARLAKNSGAAALMVVNTDKDHPDYIYSLEPEDDAEAAYAEAHIDIPVLMVSRTSGNVLTTATVQEGMTQEEIKELPNHGMPERVRLYAGGDRPFFEDVTSAGTQPTVYLIHNMLTGQECDDLVVSAEDSGAFKALDDTATSILEHITAQRDGSVKAVGIDRAVLWRGQLHSHAGKQIEERIDQVTGYPAEHFSDWHVDRFADGSFYGPHYDILPTQVPIASILVFLNDVPDEQGGEIVYPKVSDGTPVMVRPTKGLAIVHHNTDDKYQFDPTTLHAELELVGGEGDDAIKYKYVARKYIYALPQPPARRIVLPLISMVAGGTLPDAVLQLHDALLVKFGLDQGPTYFDKLMMMLPVGLLFVIATAVSYVFKGKAAGGGSGDDKKSNPSKKKPASARKRTVRAKKD
eukprot:CAMPEP_0181045242 /NCGR_PEP_ID=MMETSP1070-20121207/13700_1 /TAXON_ID=265543 /ORGANISM="Minutocellus polymorphus, Strain NH13" /LENGTH=543 /DNA_ID=CAMNT_0023123751 /DNA_START=5 /DNA_END=1636 /DNA_ORIENTATION=+